VAAVLKMFGLNQFWCSMIGLSVAFPIGGYFKRKKRGRLPAFMVLVLSD
jgi:hypothetical protein